MIIHEVEVTDYSVKPDKIKLGTSGSYGNEKIQFSFGSLWNNLSKKAIFIPSRSSPIYSVIPESGVIDVPHEATAKSGLYKFVICGYSEDRVIKSASGIYEVEAVPSDSSIETTDPTPTEIQQIYSYMQQAVLAASSVVTRADNGEFNGSDGIDGTNGINGTNGIDGAKGDKGDKGDEIQLQVTNGKELQWKYSADTTWNDLYVFPIYM